MEPNLVTNPKILPILKELSQLEPVFHRPEFGTTYSDFENMTDAAFWEVGASGYRYSREFILETLVKRAEIPPEEIWETKDFYCMEIAPDNYLLTYTLIQGERITRRSTIWRKIDRGWNVLYHQGTIVQNP